MIKDHLKLISDKHNIVETVNTAVICHECQDDWNLKI